MVDRAFLKTYLVWLETASIDELVSRRLRVLEGIAWLRDPVNRRDAKYLLRLLEAEIFARRTLLQKS